MIIPHGSARHAARRTVAGTLTDMQRGTRIHAASAVSKRWSLSRGISDICVQDGPPARRRGAMGDAVKTASNVLAELAKVKALFQQRAIVAILKKQPTQSKHDQELPDNG